MERRAKLTRRVVDSTTPEAERFILWDSDLPGFGLRVEPSGRKTFIVRYRVGGGRAGLRRQMTLGRLGVVTPDQARTEAKRILALAATGQDPAGERQHGRSEATIAELWQDYLADVGPTKRLSTLSNDRSRFGAHIGPLLGHRKVSAISRADVERFRNAVEQGKTARDIRTGPHGRSIVRGGSGAASRSLALLGALFVFAISREYITENPARGVKRRPDRRHERFLSEAELARLGDALREAEAAGASTKGCNIIRLLALTGARKGEIEGLRWDQVDLERGFLVLGNTKTGRSVRPLSAAAMALLAGLPREDSPYVFPADWSVSGFYTGAFKLWERVRGAAGLDGVRLHDLRHTAASVAVIGGASLPIVGKLLGHALPSTTARYAHLSENPVRQAADRVGAAVAAALEGRSGGEVVVLPTPQKRTRSAP